MVAPAKFNETFLCSLNYHSVFSLKSVTIDGWFYFYTIFSITKLLLQHSYLNYCNFIVGLRMGQYKPSFFSRLSVTLNSLQFHIHFKTVLLTNINNFLDFDWNDTKQEVCPESIQTHNMWNRGIYWRRYKIQETLYIGKWCLSPLQRRHAPWDLTQF